MAREDWINDEFGIERHNRGHAMFTRAITMLLVRNNLSHTDFAAFSAWCNPWGQGWMGLSQVSYLRNGKIKDPGKRPFDSLMNTNLRLAKIAGDRSPFVEALPEFGPVPSSFNVPKDPFYLRHPETGDPMHAGDLLLVSLGYLVPEGFGEHVITDEEAAILSGSLSIIAQQWILKQNLLFTKGIDKILDCCALDSKQQQLRLKNVIVGNSVFTGEELMEILPAIAGLLSLFDQKEISVNSVTRRLHDVLID